MWTTQVAKAMWKKVHNDFDAETMFSQQGHHLMPIYGIQSSHPVLPWSLHCLALMPPLVNGASSQCFPNKASPSVLAAVNVNYAQSNKSALTGHADEFGGVLDGAQTQHGLEKNKRITPKLRFIVSGIVKTGVEAKRRWGVACSRPFSCWRWTRDPLRHRACGSKPPDPASSFSHSVWRTSAHLSETPLAKET